jgi:hypothetical protein
MTRAATIPLPAHARRPDRCPRRSYVRQLIEAQPGPHLSIAWRGRRIGGGPEGRAALGYPCAVAFSSEVPGSIDFPRRDTFRRIHASGIGMNQ